MNFPVHLLVLIKCVYLSTAHPNIVEEPAKVVGGHTAFPHEYPFIVSLQTRLFYLRAHVCGGVLLNEYYVLSAAHCATESWLIRWLPLDAVAGVHNINHFIAQTQAIQVIQRIPHPRYDGGIGPHDIGLFKTIAPFIYTKVVQPIKLATNFNYGSSDVNLKLIGWGALSTTSFIPDLPNNLQEVQVTYVPYEDCYRAIDHFTEPNEDNPLDEDSNICTGPLNSGVAACVGDSGGPLLQIIKIIPPPDPVEENTEKYNASLYNCPDDNEINDNDVKDNKEDKNIGETEARLLGIVSWGVSPCGEIGAPTVYTNVMTYRYFINYNMNLK